MVGFANHTLFGQPGIRWPVHPTETLHYGLLNIHFGYLLLKWQLTCQFNELLESFQTRV